VGRWGLVNVNFTDAGATAIALFRRNPLAVWRDNWIIVLNKHTTDSVPDITGDISATVFRLDSGIYKRIPYLTGTNNNACFAFSVRHVSWSGDRVGGNVRITQEVLKW
jgi:hypothetical protein